MSTPRTRWGALGKGGLGACIGFGGGGGVRSTATFEARAAVTAAPAGRKTNVHCNNKFTNATGCMRWSSRGAAGATRGGTAAGGGGRGPSTRRPHPLASSATSRLSGRALRTQAIIARRRAAVSTPSVHRRSSPGGTRRRTAPACGSPPPSCSAGGAPPRWRRRSPSPRRA